MPPLPLSRAEQPPPQPAPEEASAAAAAPTEEKRSRSAKIPRASAKASAGEPTASARGSRSTAPRAELRTPEPRPVTLTPAPKRRPPQEASASEDLRRLREAHIRIADLQAELAAERQRARAAYERIEDPASSSSAPAPWLGPSRQTWDEQAWDSWWSWWASAGSWQDWYDTQHRRDEERFVLLDRGRLHVQAVKDKRHFFSLGRCLLSSGPGRGRRVSWNFMSIGSMSYYKVVLTC